MLAWHSKLQKEKNKYWLCKRNNDGTIVIHKSSWKLMSVENQRYEEMETQEQYDQTE